MRFTYPADVIVENPQAAEPKKHEFRHAASGGSHWEPEFVCECGKPTKSGECADCGDKVKPKLVPALDGTNNPKFRNGKPIMRILTKDVAYGRGRPAGDTFRSNSELDNLHNRKGQTPKYVRLDEGHNPDSYALHEEQQRNEKLLADKARLLKRMTREQLAEYAEEIGVSVDGKSKREAILDDVLKHESLATV